MHTKTALLLFASFSAAASQGLSFEGYGNNVFAGEPTSRRTVSTLEGVDVGSGVSSSIVTGSMTFPRSGWHGFNCSFAGTSLAFVWVDGHLVCTDSKFRKDPTHPNITYSYVDSPLLVSNSRRTLPVRAHFYRNASVSGVQSSFTMRWGDNNTLCSPIPSDVLSASLGEAEETREKMQRSLVKGWGNWNNFNLLDVVRMPDSAVITTILCKDTQCINGTCIEPFRAGGVEVRVGARAADLSYSQLFVGNHSGALNVNVSIEFATSPDGKDMTLLVTPQKATTGPGHTLILKGRFAWYREGTVKTSSTSTMTLQGAGLDETVLYTSAGGVRGGDFLEFPLDNGAVVVSTKPTSVESAQMSFAALARAHQTHLEEEFGEKNMTEVAEAVQTSVMWNLMYTPLENGPFFPVSRAWDRVGDYSSTDFKYVIFDWDNFFASLLSSFVSRDLAYSNFIQTSKSKTAAGFIPNKSAAGLKSQDRSEPPVGAKVALELYNRFHDKWFLEVIFDDMLDWSNWFLRERTLAPLDMVCLGSWNELAVKQNPSSGYVGNTMHDAALESGLDNSPMYDGDFFNTSTHKMGLYDVGFNSLVASDAKALAEIARILNRDEAAALQSRADLLSHLISRHLWNDDLKIFTNRFQNNTMSTRISPTSFYPMLVKAATEEQAEAMAANWLMSPEHFCVSPSGDMKGNHDDCYWGLPSIQRADPAYPALGYWRGYVWGPLAQIVFWGLQQYETAAVVTGRKALCAQMKELLLSQWRDNRHICENYGPHKNTSDCTGDQFYHWGALTGYINLVEAGL